MPMFFAQMNGDPEVSTFLTIPNAYLVGETRFDSIVRAVLAAAVEVAAGRKDIIHVDRQYASTSIHRATRLLRVHFDRIDQCQQQHHQSHSGCKAHSGKGV